METTITLTYMVGKIAHISDAIISDIENRALELEMHEVGSIRNYADLEADFSIEYEFPCGVLLTAEGKARRTERYYRSNDYDVPSCYETIYQDVIIDSINVMDADGFIMDDFDPTNYRYHPTGHSLSRDGRKKQLKNN